MRKPDTREWWAEETAFIQSVDTEKPGRMFSYTKSTFQDYCRMQAQDCREDGFPDLADQIVAHAELKG